MKIAFITSSLEPGRDGLGDYTIGFAEELLQRGHQVMAVSLRDTFVKETVVTRRQSASGEFQTIRVPAELPWTQTIGVTKRELDIFDPDWASVQFVTYTYDDKGMVNGLYEKLAPLLSDRKLHLMFHEVWRGAQRGAPLKERLVGAAQKYFIMNFVHRAKPLRVHTSNLAYRELLRKNGIDAGVLPLFGNIAVNKSPSGWMDAELAKAGVTGQNRENFCVLGIFGSVPAEFDVEECLRRIQSAAGKMKKQLLLLTAGSSSVEARERLEKMSRSLSIPVANFGSQSQERLSEFLQSLDFGVATAPWSILGKSGTAAAMIEHGLPVLVFRDDVDLGVMEPGGPQLIKMEGDWERKMQEARRLTPNSLRPGIVNTFLADLRINEPVLSKPLPQEQVVSV